MSGSVHNRQTRDKDLGGGRFSGGVFGEFLFFCCHPPPQKKKMGRTKTAQALLRLPVVLMNDVNPNKIHARFCGQEIPHNSTIDFTS